MKTTILAAAALLALGLTPAFAGEGNNEPFPNTASYAPSHSVRYARFARDTGSNQYPNVTGRPGSDLPSLAGDVLPSNGSEGAVQTANSLPTGFENGTVAYAQAKSVSNWLLARAPQEHSIYSAVSHAKNGG